MGRLGNPLETMGLNFSVKPGLIEYSEFLLPFKLLFRNIKHEDLCIHETESISSSHKLKIC